MITRFIIFFCILGISVSAFTQSKRDYIWMEGQNYTNELEGIEGTYFDWRSGELDYYYVPLTNEIGASNASICDEETGDLLFYSNGCRIMNADHEVMENGEGINTGAVYQSYCFPDDTYPSRNNDLILPDPANSEGYFHFTKEFNFDTTVVSPGLRIAYIDLNYNNGLGKVTEKGIRILDSIPFLSSYSMACLHANGSDWWIVSLERYSNHFHTLLLDDTGLHYQGFQAFGRELVGSSAGNMRFSPKGDQMAIYSVPDDLILLDFDNATGEFSNYQLLDFPEDEELGLFSGLEYSPNGEYIYIASWKKLHQVEVDNLDLESGVELVGNWTFPTDGDIGLDYFSHALLGPDCKIYITAGNGCNYAHVIHSPNERGAACDFEFRAIRYPYAKNISSLPNIPKFRTAEDLCDLTSSVDEDAMLDRGVLVLSPNPVDDILTIECGLQSRLTERVTITNQMGQSVLQEALTQSPQRIDVSALAAGLYFVTLQRDNEAIITQKLLVD